MGERPGPAGGAGNGEGPEPLAERTARALARVQDATARVLGSAAALTGAQVREPSLLPGWTRGHVLTHLARNADGLANLLRWARTGQRTPMYASAQARAADIEAGAGRPAADLVTDLRDSAAAFAGEAGQMPAAAWAVQVEALAGGPFPAWEVLNRREREVEIHHVDLAAGYRPGDWPAGFAARNLPPVAAAFAGRAGAPACRLAPEGGGTEFVIGPAGASPQILVTGPAAGLLAWLAGRSAGEDLAVRDGAALPALPGWG